MIKIYYSENKDNDTIQTIIDINRKNLNSSCIINGNTITLFDHLETRPFQDAWEEMTIHEMTPQSKTQKLECIFINLSYVLELLFMNRQKKEILNLIDSIKINTGLEGIENFNENALLRLDQNKIPYTLIKE